MNKRNITIFADSSVGLTESIKDRVKLIPLYLYFKPEEIHNELEMDRQHFFKELENSQAFTSACNPGDIEDMLDEELDKGNDIIVFSLSSGISSTFGTISMIAEELKEKGKIEVVDTKCTSAGMSFIIEDTLKAIENGATVEEAAALARSEANNINIYFVVDDLKYLARGGRINNSVAKIGEVLNIKPILSFGTDGKLEAISKARGTKAAISTINKLVNNKDNKKAIIVTGNNEGLYTELSNKLGITERVDIDLVVSSHTGPNIAAVVVHRA